MIFVEKKKCYSVTIAKSIQHNSIWITHACDDDKAKSFVCEPSYAVRNWIRQQTVGVYTKSEIKFLIARDMEIRIDVRLSWVPLYTLYSNYKQKNDEIDIHTPINHHNIIDSYLIFINLGIIIIQSRNDWMCKVWIRVEFDFEGFVINASKLFIQAYIARWGVTLRLICFTLVAIKSFEFGQSNSNIRNCLVGV